MSCILRSCRSTSSSLFLLVLHDKGYEGGEHTVCWTCPITRRTESALLVQSSEIHAVDS